MREGGRVRYRFWPSKTDNGCAHYRFWTLFHYRFWTRSISVLDASNTDNPLWVLGAGAIIGFGCVQYRCWLWVSDVHLHYRFWARPKPILDASNIDNLLSILGAGPLSVLDASNTGIGRVQNRYWLWILDVHLHSRFWAHRIPVLDVPNTGIRRVSGIRRV